MDTWTTGTVLRHLWSQGGREWSTCSLQFDKLIQSKYLSHSNECTEQYSTISVQVSISNNTCSWATDSSEILIEWLCFSSVQCSRSVVSDSLWRHGLQHSRPPCPTPAPGVYPNSCSLSRWCHPTISSSVVPFSSRLQSFPTSRSFPISQLFGSCGQNIGIQLQHQSFQWTLRTDFL